MRDYLLQFMVSAVILYCRFSKVSPILHLWNAENWTVKYSLSSESMEKCTHWFLTGCKRRAPYLQCLSSIIQGSLVCLKMLLLLQEVCAKVLQKRLYNCIFNPQYFRAVSFFWGLATSLVCWTLITHNCITRELGKYPVLRFSDSVDEFNHNWKASPDEYKEVYAVQHVSACPAGCSVFKYRNCISSSKPSNFAFPLKTNPRLLLAHKDLA